jgi:hypothetical protein
MLDANGKSSSTIKLPSAAAVLSDPPFTSSESAGATGAGTNKRGLQIKITKGVWLGEPNLATQDDPFQFSKFVMLHVNGRSSSLVKLPSAAESSM